MSSNSRRRFIQGLGLSAIAAGSIYSCRRGIRYPTLGLEPNALASTFVNKGGSIEVDSADVIETTQTNNDRLTFRAFSAEPRLKVTAKEDGQAFIELGNVATDASLSWDGSQNDIEERVSGIRRSLTISMKKGDVQQLSWKLPYESDFTFASIGDSGGDKELAWCIQRAHELGAKFLLHLGDFNYQPGDYQRSIDLFNNSPIPCYVSIGNHDFHENGAIYQQFLEQIGPLNHSFTIGKTRFLNLDTAANTLPYSSGLRGKLVKEIQAQNSLVTDTVSFTHRPLHDPLHNSTHDIGSEGERDWLISALKMTGSSTLLSGHIHIYDRTEFHGIDNIIAGQGLGHQDLITRSDYSKIVIGRVSNDGSVNYTAEPLSMPMELHCHPRSQPVIDSLRQSNSADEYEELLNMIETSCASTQTTS